MNGGAPCNVCKQQVPLEVSNPKIINLRNSAVLIFEHEGPKVCPHCGTNIVPIVGGVAGLAMGFGVTPPEREKSLIIPGTVLPGGRKLEE